MASQVVEFFGYKPLDPVGLAYAAEIKCPFVQNKCIKPKHGACSMRLTGTGPIVICPNRLYDSHFEVLQDIAEQAFGANAILTRSDTFSALKSAGALTGNEVAVFGKYWGSELSIPQPRGVDKDLTPGGFYIDFVLARLAPDGSMSKFTAVEIQTIDTTNSYKKQVEAFFAGKQYQDDKGNMPGWSKSGLNWANVSKRILPQLIYKGYVLRREKDCEKGLYFVCPTAVLEKIRARLGTKMLDYPVAAGTITFQAYDIGPEVSNGQRRALVKGETFTTTVEQVAYAFVSPVNLPAMGVYEKAIVKALAKLEKKFALSSS